MPCEKEIAKAPPGNCSKVLILVGWKFCGEKNAILPPKTNISPEKCWLEDEISFEMASFEVTCYFLGECQYRTTCDLMECSISRLTTKNRSVGFFESSRSKRLKMSIVRSRCKFFTNLRPHKTIWHREDVFHNGYFVATLHFGSPTQLQPWPHVQSIKFRPSAYIWKHAGMILHKLIPPENSHIPWKGTIFKKDISSSFTINFQGIFVRFQGGKPSEKVWKHDFMLQNRWKISSKFSKVQWAVGIWGMKIPCHSVVLNSVCPRLAFIIRCQKPWNIYTKTTVEKNRILHFFSKFW